MNLLTICLIFLLAASVTQAKSAVDIPDLLLFEDDGVKFYQESKISPKCSNDADTLFSRRSDGNVKWEEVKANLGCSWSDSGILNFRCCDSEKDSSCGNSVKVSTVPRVFVERPQEPGVALNMSDIKEDESLRVWCWAPQKDNLRLQLETGDTDSTEPEQFYSEGIWLVKTTTVKENDWFRCKVFLNGTEVAERKIILDPHHTENSCLSAVEVKQPENELQTAEFTPYLTTVILTLGGISTVILCVLMLRHYFINIRRDRRMKSLFELTTLPNGPILSNGQLPPAYVILQRTALKNIKWIGGGSFGDVHSCEWRVGGACYLVANKMLKKNSREPGEPDEMRRELTALRHISFHPHVLTLLAAVKDPEGVFCIVTELCEESLEAHVRDFGRELKKKNESDRDAELSMRNTIANFVCYSLQICRGMVHLHTKTEAGSCVHRDLALRNILLTSDRIVRISDFGLARHVQDPSDYYRIIGSKIPFTTYAPECFEDFRVGSVDKLPHKSSRFSTKSDVWSFGFLLYELFALGESLTDAYRSAGVDTTSPWSILQFIDANARLPRPRDCPSEVYDIIKQCWKKETAERPDFEKLEKRFSRLLAGMYSNEQLDDFAQRVAQSVEKQCEWREVVIKAAELQEQANSSETPLSPQTSGNEETEEIFLLPPPPKHVRR